MKKRFAAFAGMVRRFVKLMSKLAEHHSWFRQHSRTFVGVGHGKIVSGPWALCFGRKYTMVTFAYWPVAWIKFMWFSRHEILSA